MGGHASLATSVARVTRVTKVGNGKNVQNSMRKKIPVRPNEPPKEAELVEVTSSSEPWSTYLLSDGTHVRMKVVLSEVWRVIDEYDKDGNPVYVIQSAGIMNTQAPDALKRPT